MHCSKLPYQGHLPTGFVASYCSPLCSDCLRFVYFYNLSGCKCIIYVLCHCSLLSAVVYYMLAHWVCGTYVIWHYILFGIMILGNTGAMYSFPEM